jgi:signal peptide peptidase SppA
MGIQLNPKARAHARQLITDGQVDRDSPWRIDADEENALLGDDDWAQYALWFLGLDESENSDTKAHYRYPVGKAGRVYRSALIAIRQRAGQQDDSGIFETAGELIGLIDGDQGASDGDAAPTGSADKPISAVALDSLALDAHRLAMSAIPWALMPECLAAVAQPFAAPVQAARPVKSRAGNASNGAIAVLSLTGVITQHPDWMGDTSLDGFMMDFLTAMNDPAVGALLISIDSPGGSVYGVQEVSETMQARRGQKPVITIANSLAASAAYWIGCQADQFYCTPGGEVGSIGVWQAHMDISGMLAQAGIHTTVISAGRYKTDGNPYQPLDAEAQAFMQSRVDDYYAAFVDAVASARGVRSDVVKNGMGQGRVLGAADALRQNMIDGVMTLPQVLQQMAQQLSAKSPQPVRKVSGSSRSRLAILA